QQSQRRERNRPGSRLLRRFVAVPCSFAEWRDHPGERAEPAAHGEADRRVGRRGVSVLGSAQHDSATRMSNAVANNGHDSRTWLRRAVMVPYVWLLLFFLAPFLIILKISFAEPVVAQPPFTALLEWTQQGFAGIHATFENFAFLFQDRYYGIIYLES